MTFLPSYLLVGTWIQTKLLKQNQAKKNEWAASPSPLGKQFIEVTLVEGHVLRQKCLEVEDILAAHGNPVLVEGRRLDNLVLERVVQIPHELQSEGLDDDFGGDALMRSSYNFSLAERRC